MKPISPFNSSCTSSMSKICSSPSGFRIIVLLLNDGSSYDDLNRITAAYYQLPGTVVPTADTYSASYGYDSNGNLLTLQRNGNEAGVSGVIGIDDLIYTYDKGNKLQNVWDKEGYSARSE